jgi:glycine/D-amino acid oxidase-like deaminating enzyme
MNARTVDVLIVGAGFAGAATAYHLSRDFRGSIVVIEQEEVPGTHASGRNASLLRQPEADPDLRAAAVRSRAAYLEHRREIGFDEVGSLLLGRREQLDAERDDGLFESLLVDPEEARRRVPLLRGHRFEAALHTPGDGVVDVWSLLNFYLSGARSRGVELLTDCELTHVDGGPPYLVTTTRGRFEAGYLIDAAGAWASSIGVLAGVHPPPIEPLRRHLFILDGVHEEEGREPDPTRPWVWSLDRGFYFRPDSGGLLFSICDEERTDGLGEAVSPGIGEELAHLVLENLPAFEGATVRKIWSCFRTRNREDRFVIGADPEREGFFWVAGLGGHGMSCSWEVGRIAARALLDPQAPNPFAPARLVAR